MNRPYVSLKSENIAEELLTALHQSIELFTSLNGVVGIVLDGGLSRGYGDHLSEIDVLIYLHEKQFNEYQQGTVPFALGITVINGYLFDIKLMNYEYELTTELEPVALWDLSYASIIHDPNGKIAELIQKKLSKTVDLADASDLLWVSYWNYQLAGNIWIHRQDSLQGHLIFNDAIKPLIGALFIANKEYIPHDKWLIHMSHTLSWKPDNWKALLTSALNTGDFSIDSLISRQKAIDTLWNSISDKLCQMTQFKGILNFVQKISFDNLMKFTEKDEYTLAEWQEVYSLEALNYEPIHSIFKRHSDKVIFCKERLLALKPDEMYIWLYTTADALRKAL